MTNRLRDCAVFGSGLLASSLAWATLGPYSPHVVVGLDAPGAMAAPDAFEPEPEWGPEPPLDLDLGPGTLPSSVGPPVVPEWEPVADPETYRSTFDRRPSAGIGGE